MVHPMYKIDKEVKKYPLFGKALENTGSALGAALFWVLGEMGTLEFPRQIIQTVENNFKATDAEKQALMIGVLYSIAPEEWAKGKATFETEFDAPTARILGQITFGKKKAVLATDFARVATVMNTVTFLSQAKMFEGEKASPAMITQMRAGIAKVENSFLKNLDSPELEQAYQKSKQDFFAQTSFSLHEQ